MAKLYPPYIEGSIPAFFGNTLIVPYEMNQTVGYKDIAGFKLKIMTVTTNSLVGYVDSFENDLTKNEVKFIMPIDKMIIGQFYKIQLAYLNIDNEVGFYSNIGVVKYTSMPRVKIEKMNAGTINLHTYNYIGSYEPNKNDITEKEKFYQFDVYDNEGNLYYTSGQKVHNALEEDIFEFSDTLDQKKIYYLQYTVQTVNDLKISTPKYRIAERESLEIEFNFDLKAELNYDEGYIDLFLVNSSNEPLIATGSFVLVKSSEEDDYKIWNEIYNFEYINEPIRKNLLFKDFIVKQGVKYKYAIRQFNSSGLYSQPKVGTMDYGTYTSEECIADFEDMFLFDGERQLKLRFNGKVNNYKTSLLEQKVNSIGSKYPFIFRNSNVAYKEFSLSGLISYYMDNEKLFIIEENKNEKHRHSTPSNLLNNLNGPTDLSSENYKIERLFKNKVLDWLNNGKPKIFKSAAEGCFIVKILNTSLTPEDRLGRLIHNFQATAYEIADFNYKNFLEYDFIRLNAKERYQAKWETIPLYSNGEFFNGIVNPLKPALSVEFNNMKPGDIVLIDDKEIKIGVTGDLELNYDTPIGKIEIPEGSKYFGFVTFNYQDTVSNEFKKIKNIHLEEIPLAQVDGKKMRINDLVSYIEDVRTDVLNFYLLRFYLKDYSMENINNCNTLTIGKSVYDLTDLKTYEIDEPLEFNKENKITFGDNIVCEYSCQLKITTFNVETREDDLKELKEKWESAKKDYYNQIDIYRKLIPQYYNSLKKLEEDYDMASLRIKRYLKEKNNNDNLLKTYVNNTKIIDGKTELIPVDDWIENEPDTYSLLENYHLLPMTLEEAIDYSSFLNDTKNRPIVRDNIYKEIIKNQRLNNNQDFEEFLWGDLGEIFQEIEKKYLISEDNVYDDLKAPTKLSFTMVIPGKEDEVATGENYPKALYSTEEPDFVKGSLWVDEENGCQPCEPFEAYNKDDNETGEFFYIDVCSFKDDIDPDVLGLKYDIWLQDKVSNANIDTLNDIIYLFRYKNNNYMDLAYIESKDDNYVYCSACDENRNNYHELITDKKSSEEEEEFVFKNERYIIDLNKQYGLVRMTENKEELEARIIELKNIKKRTKSEEFELTVMEHNVNNPIQGTDQYILFVPVTHKEIYEGAISLYCNTTNSLYELYGRDKENFNFQPTFKIDDLNKYFHYKTIDIWEIKKFIEENKNINEKIQEQNDILNIYNKDEETEGSKAYYETQIEQQELIINNLRQKIQSSYQNYIDKLVEVIDRGE